MPRWLQEIVESFRAYSKARRRGATQTEATRRPRRDRLRAIRRARHERAIEASGRLRHTGGTRQTSVLFGVRHAGHDDRGRGERGGQALRRGTAGQRHRRAAAKRALPGGAAYGAQRPSDLLHSRDDGAESERIRSAQWNEYLAGRFAGRNDSAAFRAASGQRESETAAKEELTIQPQGAP